MFVLEGQDLFMDKPSTPLYYEDQENLEFLLKLLCKSLLKSLQGIMHSNLS